MSGLIHQSDLLLVNCLASIIIIRLNFYSGLAYWQMRRVSRRIEPVTVMAIVAVSPKPFAQVIIFIAHIYFSDAQACTVYTLVSKGTPFSASDEGKLPQSAGKP